MADRLTPEQRRRCMQANRCVNTSPEVRLRKALHARGFRYVLGAKLPGRPDMVFPSRRVALFVDGCFWHRCPTHSVLPGSRQEWWRQKLEANVLRDRRTDALLAAEGWKVIRVWEHDIRRNMPATVLRVSGLLNCC